MLNAVSSRQSGQIIVEKFPERPQSGLIVERFIVKTTVHVPTCRNSYRGFLERDPSVTTFVTIFVY